jgi:hypothetical protein
MSSLKQIRSNSLREAKRLGYPVNSELPLLGVHHTLRSTRELASRILCMTAVVAAAWGYPRGKALKRVLDEKLTSELTQSETDFLNGGGDELQVRWQVEGLWALAWCANFVVELDFEVECSDTLVTLLPDLRSSESAAPYYDRVALQDRTAIISKCDLAYCLHWAIRDAAVRGQRAPGSLQPIRVVERRRALEWMVGQDDWDTAALDT